MWIRKDKDFWKKIYIHGSMITNDNDDDDEVPVHMDHRGGDRDHHAEEGRQQAQAAADLYQATLSVVCFREHHHHKSSQSHLKQMF